MALETCLGEVDMLTLERVINVLVEWKDDDVQECLNVGIGKAEEPFTDEEAKLDNEIAFYVKDKAEFDLLFDKEKTPADFVAIEVNGIAY